jgi:ribonuclease HI
MERVLGNPGPGGWGAILMYGETKKEISGANKETTNNIMEITAVLEALKLLKEECNVEVYSDSAYVVNAFNQGWIYNWQKNNWKTASKDPVKNRELWEQLYSLTTKHKVKFIKVKGHSDNEFNNRCDFLATSAIKEL